MSKELAVKQADLPAIAQERGIEPHQWNALKQTVWPNASDDMVALGIDYCKARKLDPLKKVIHIVKTYDSQQGKLVESIWPGIAEPRTTAMRTKEYAGKDEAIFGPDVTKKIGNVQLTFPEWCQVTVYRLVNGEPRAFAGERVYWEETYAKTKDGPNSMWRKRPRGQLAKCAEASALRTAFPEELGGQQTAEEMEGQTIGEDFDNAGGEPKPARPAPPPKGGVAGAKAEGKTEPAKKTATKKAAKQEPEKTEAVDGEYTDIPEEPASEEKPAERPAPPPKSEKPAEKPAEKAEQKEPITEVATGETHEGLTVEITKFAKTKANGRDLIMLATKGDLKALPVYAWADTVDADVLAQGNTAVVSVAGLQQSGKGKPAVFITAAEAHVNF